VQYKYYADMAISTNDHKVHAEFLFSTTRYSCIGQHSI
jgi:hypothetical protein